MTYKSEYQKRMETPCVPPTYFEKRGGCFWVQQRDFDGRSGYSMTVMEWQPGAHAWCKPGNAGTGQEDLLLGYEIVAYCPTPVFRVEAEELLDTLTNVSKRFGDNDKAEITREEFKLLHRLLFEGMVMERDFKKPIRSNLT